MSANAIPKDQLSQGTSGSLATDSKDQATAAGRPLLGGRVTLLAYPEVWKAWICGFIVVLMLAEGGARVIEPTAGAPVMEWYDANAQVRVEMMSHRKSDVVFVGTSMAWQAFVPEHFDAHASGQLTSFNAGLVGAVPVVTAPWLLDVVVPALKPEVVVWGVSSLDLSSSYGDKPADAWNSASQSRSDVLGRVDRLLGTHSALLRIRSDVRRPDDYWGTGAEVRAAELSQAQSVTESEGQRLGFDVDKSEQRMAIERARLRNFWIDVNDVAAMELAIRDLQDQGVRVVLVELPVAPSFVGLHPQGAQDHDKVGALLGLLADGLGVEYLDLSTGYVEDDFVDFTHLTGEAAIRFTEECARALYPT